MDGHRFVTSMRDVASKRSRRHIVRSLVASGAAALSLRRGVRNAAGQEAETSPPDTCRQDSDCIVAVADACTGAYCDAGACTHTNVSCLPDHVCCGNGECCPADTATPSAEASDGEGQPKKTDSGGFTRMATTRSP
jgi:hypothetical protein